MNFVLVAGDYAQSEVLRMLGEKLVEAGHQVVSFLCYGRLNEFPLESIVASIEGANWLVAGMSENSTEEVAAVQATFGLGVKVGLYADTFDAHGLKAFESVRGCVSALFVINNEEADGARALFPETVICVTGNPRWEDFAFPILSRSEALQKLGIAEGRRVILSVGDKYLAQNIVQFGATIDAVRALDWEESTDILLALHPGDTEYHTLYDNLPTIAGCSVRIIGKHVGIKAGDILPACNLVVEFASSVGIHAICQRIPVIDFCSVFALRGKKFKTGDPWKPAAGGATLPVYHGSTDVLMKAMFDLDGPSQINQRLRQCQEQMFPVPALESRGQCIKSMLRALGVH